MSAARRLLLGTAGGSGAVTIDPPSRTISAAPSGGWTQVQLDRAAHLAGYTYYGYHDGQSGNNELRVWTHATDSVGSAITVKAGIGGVEGSPDSHAAPVLLIRSSDHRLLVFYSGHATAQLYLRISTNSLDSDPTISGGLDLEVNLDSSLGKSLYTYPSVVQLNGVTNDPLYLFFRDTQGSGGTETSVLCYSTSTDGGATWAAATELMKRANYLPYWVVDSDFDTRIDVLVMDGTAGAGESPAKTWHMYFQGGSWRGTNGTAIGGSTPYAPSALTAVYDASDGDTVHMWDVNTNGGEPVALVPIDLGTDCRLDWCRWTGSAWDCQTITTVATGDGSTGGLCFDSANPNVVYYVTADWAIVRAQTADDGATWSFEQLETATSNLSNAPVRIRDRASDLRILWAKGTGVSYLDYDVGTYGATR